MFRFNNPSKKADVEGSGAAGSGADEDDRHHYAENRNSHEAATSPRSPLTNNSKGSSSSDDDDHHRHKNMHLMPLALTSSKRTLKQAALAGLPRFFAKEKARVITTTDVALRSSKTWNIKMPPIKKHMVSGHLVPYMVGMGGRVLFVQRDRKISIEIHGPTTTTASSLIRHPHKEQHLKHDDDDVADSHHTEEEGTTSMMEELLEGGSPRAETDQLVLNDNDVVVVRILQTSHSSDNVVPDHSHNHHEDDLSTLGQEAPGDEADGGGRHEVEHGSYRLEDVVLMKRFGRTCEMKYTDSSRTVIRDLKFESEKLAMNFEKYLIRIKDLDNARLHRKADGYRQQQQQRQLHSHSPSSSSPHGEKAGSDAASLSPLAGGDDVNADNTMINLLVEIVSATDLPVADVFSTDSYVKVRMGNTDIHRTQVISNARSPIWSLETDSLFLLQMTPEQFFASSNGMVFIIKDYDSIGSSTVLGRVVVSHTELLEGKGERLEYEIVPESSTSTVQQQTRPSKYDKKGKKIQNNNGHRDFGKKRPKLYLRFKEASRDDIDFMEVYNKRKGKVGVYAEETYLPPRPPDMQFLKRQTKWSTCHGDINKNISHEKQLLHRVKPYPDPANAENTTWLTSQEIEDQAMAPSTDWLEVGSGDIGRLYVEVIRCDGLPSMDKGTLNLLDKTDAFCCLLFEDGVVNTDVIGDTFSPRWMPWCRRAFSFRIAHPQSDLIIGVFDYDPPHSPMQIATQAIGSLHDPIGRCVVRLSRLLPQTEYTLTYPLYFGEWDENREKARGTLTLRVRIHYYDKRKTLLAAVKPLAPSLLSCPTQVDYELLDYTSQGAEDANAFSVATLTRHIKELQGYKKALPYLTDAVYTICFWRGHFQIHVFGKTIYLPIHSIVAFTWVILLCRSFDVFPSFLVFSIGWVFLGTNECRQRNPSPWNRTFSYGQFWSMLVVNRNIKESIHPFQNHDKVKAYEEEMKQREQQREKERELAKTYEAELRKVLLDDIEDAEADDVDITTRKTRLQDAFSSKFWVFKPVLYPVQLQLGNWVLRLRIVKNIILWAETYFAVWIATISFVVAAVIFFLPWGFIVGWTIRLCLLLVTGPWMAIVDRYYFRERPGMTDEEREDEIRRRIQLKYESVTKAASDFQIKKERAIKLRSMKRYLYGKYIVRVPAFNTDKYVDSPLPESFAKPVSTKMTPPINITGRKYGQILKGDMIPMRELQQAAKVTKTETPLRQLKSAMDFVGQQPGNAAMSAMRLVGGGNRPEEQHEKIPLLSTLTRPFQKGYQTTVGLVSPHTTSTIMEDPNGESSEHSAGNSNINNNNTMTMETKVVVDQCSTTAQNRTFSI